MDQNNRQFPTEGQSSASTGSEIPWSEINDAVRRMVLTDKGKRRAANLISKIAQALAENDGCEDLANSGIAVQRYIVEAWENRWLRDRPGESQNRELSD